MVSLSISCCCYDDLGLQGEGGGGGVGGGASTQVFVGVCCPG